MISSIINIINIIQFLVIWNSTVSCNHCGIAHKENVRIVEHVASAAPYPWTVGIVEFSKPTDSQNIVCLGSVISERDILTAAHCVKAKLLPLGVVTNLDGKCEENRTIIQVETEIVHPKYASKKPYYDFAVLRLAMKVNNMPVCLPSSNDKMASHGVALSFNRSSCTQQDLIMPVLRLTQCLQMITRNVYYFEQNIRSFEAAFCAGYLNSKGDTCQGDSGGGFLMPTVRTHIYTIFGVTSFGFRGCNVENTAGVYADVREVAWWIRQVAVCKTYVRGE